MEKSDIFLIILCYKIISLEQGFKTIGVHYLRLYNNKGMENFRKIKDEIVCYNRKDLIACATNYINRVDTDLKEEIFPYWTYLTLIRWSLEYSSDLLILKKFTPENCQDLATKIFNLKEVHDFLNFNLYKGWFFNVLAYQQFRFQRNDFPLEYV